MGTEIYGQKPPNFSDLNNSDKNYNSDEAPLIARTVWRNYKSRRTYV